MIAELLEDDQQHIIARGGKGGLGNAAFAHSTNQAPRYATDGKKGEEVHVELELKLLADVGIIGLPNAGKSTLTARISAARPLVADYPFTTLYPVLGVVKMGFDSFVIADIPGLIEGAHAGSGLGHKFLRHIERTRILLHLVDIGSPDADSPARQVKAIEDELEQYRAELSTKPKLLAGNKIDLNPAPDKIDALKTYANQTGCDYCLVSGATGEGVDDMLKKLFELLQSVPRTEEHRESGS
jgi:GTP-binding protein